MANLLPRIGFIDETSLKTNMAKTTVWSPKGARLLDHALSATGTRRRLSRRSATTGWTRPGSSTAR